MELFEFLFLLPPGIAVVSCEMRVFLERRIVVRGKHFRMRVDVNPLSGGLFQKHLQIAQVMAGNQDARAVADSKIHLCDFWIAVGVGIRLVQQRHALYTKLAGLQCKSCESGGIQ